MKKKFITTQDIPTATLLSKQGYQQVQNSNGIYVFLNAQKFSIAICLHSNHSPALSGISTKKGGIG